MQYDLPANLCLEIVRLAKRFNLKKLILFGSRARKTNHEYSDVDLAVSGGDVTGFSLAVDEETGKCPVVFTLTRKGGMNGDLCFDALSINQKMGGHYGYQQHEQRHEPDERRTDECCT